MNDLPDIRTCPNTLALGIHIRQVNMLQLLYIIVTISHHLQQCIVSIYSTSVYSCLVKNLSYTAAAKTALFSYLSVSKHNYITKYKE